MRVFSDRLFVSRATGGGGGGLGAPGSDGEREGVGNSWVGTTAR